MAEGYTPCELGDHADCIAKSCSCKCHFKASPMTNQNPLPSGEEG